MVHKYATRLYCCYDRFISSYLSEFKANNDYNYRYLLSEIIGTFINSVFLFFISIYIVFESVERFIEPKEVHSENLILVSFIGLNIKILVNIVGLIFAHDHGEDSHDHHHHEHEHEDDDHHHDQYDNHEKHELKEKEHKKNMNIKMTIFMQFITYFS